MGAGLLLGGLAPLPPPSADSGPVPLHSASSLASSCQWRSARPPLSSESAASARTRSGFLEGPPGRDEGASSGARNAAHWPGRMRPTTVKRLFPSGRMTSVSRSAGVIPVVAAITPPCVTRAVIVPGGGFVVRSRRTARICCCLAASSCVLAISSNAPLTAARPENTSRAVSRARQTGLVNTPRPEHSCA
jgi:hypothetical protein